MPVLSLVTFLPLVGALILLLIPSAKTGVIRGFAFLVTVLTFLASLPLFTAFKFGQRGMQFVERVPWVPNLGIEYHRGVDGVSVLLILMTTLITAVAVAYPPPGHTTRPTTPEISRADRAGELPPIGERRG